MVVVQAVEMVAQVAVARMQVVLAALEQVVHQAHALAVATDLSAQKKHRQVISAVVAMLNQQDQMLVAIKNMAKAIVANNVSQANLKAVILVAKVLKVKALKVRHLEISLKDVLINPQGHRLVNQVIHSQNLVQEVHSQNQVVTVVDLVVNQERVADLLVLQASK